MLNLLRMDLYRLLRSKSFYVCLGCLIVVNLIAFSFLYMLGIPELRDMLVQKGATVTGDMGELERSLAEVTILDLFHEGTISGGFFALMVGVLASLFVCSDFESGFIKNILTAHENKWDYILSKISCFMIVNLSYLAITYLLCLLPNVLSGGFFAYVPAADTLLYLCTAWMLMNGFSAVILLVCTITRSKAFGVAAAICLGSGLIVSAVGGMLSIFDLHGFMDYTLYINLAALPTVYDGAVPLKPIVLGAVCLIGYTVVSKVILTKKDI